ncbi:cation:proton antiporter domain-containing protein [Streptomyces sp. NPDC001719]
MAFAVSYRWGHHLGRPLAHPYAEQLMLRVLDLTLAVAALAELVHVSAAVGAFLIGLTLTSQTAARNRAVLGPLRGLFAAVFFTGPVLPAWRAARPPVKLRARRPPAGDSPAAEPVQRQGSHRRAVAEVTPCRPAATSATARLKGSCKPRCRTSRRRCAGCVRRQ